MRMFLSIAVMSLLLLYVWERVDLVRVGYKIQHLTARYTVLQRANDELKMTVSALTSPERIERVATEQLGMIRPGPGQIVLLNPDGNGPMVQTPKVAAVRLVRNDPRW